MGKVPVREWSKCHLNSRIGTARSHERLEGRTGSQTEVANCLWSEETDALGMLEVKPRVWMLCGVGSRQSSCSKGSSERGGPLAPFKLPTSLSRASLNITCSSGVNQCLVNAQKKATHSSRNNNGHGPGAFKTFASIISITMYIFSLS